MFKRPHHIQIATVLLSLDGELLNSYGCYFAGGTAIALSRGEYRESVDIDFLISNLDGYRELRKILVGAKGIQSIARKGAKLECAREIRTDQYGVRTRIKVGDTEIKFEIVNEARIKLEKPGAKNIICGVHSLCEVDMVASKLLANSDRWHDDSVFSRDLIDLSMLEPSKKSWSAGKEKAMNAYGDCVLKDLEKAIDAIRKREGRLKTCMRALKMDMPRALLWQKIVDLSKLMNF